MISRTNVRTYAICQGLRKFFLVSLSSSLQFFMSLYSINVAYCILCSADRTPVSINISLFDLLTGSLNILFKIFPCILSISFTWFPSFLSFFMYPHASIPYVSAGMKPASKSFNCTLISSFSTPFFDPIISIFLLIGSHFYFNSSMSPFRSPSSYIVIPETNIAKININLFWKKLFRNTFFNILHIGTSANIAKVMVWQSKI